VSIEYLSADGGRGFAPTAINEAGDVTGSSFGQNTVCPIGRAGANTASDIRDGVR